MHQPAVLALGSNAASRTWLRKLQIWCHRASAPTLPAQQVDLGGVAEHHAICLSTNVIQYGAKADDRRVVGFSYLMWILPSSFEVFDEERDVRLGAPLLDFTARRRKRVDSVIAR